jgi:hypothetical protein
LAQSIKNKTLSIINIGGLAVSMAVVTLIGLWIYNEVSFDKYHQNYDRIARVMQHQTYNGKIQTQEANPYPLSAEIRRLYGMHQWLQKFEYRTDIPVWVLVLSALGVLVITLLTVSFQAIKAAVANPVKSLRTE